MILDYLDLVIDWQILGKVQDYVCIVGVQYVLRLINLYDATNPIEPVRVILRHHLIPSAPLMHPLVHRVVYSDSVLPIEAHDHLV